MSTQLIEIFWETIPPVWRQTRTKIRSVAAERFGLTVEQFQALRRIRKGYDSISALAEEGRLSRSQASRAVEALVRRDFVRRVTDAHDRRREHLSLTENGEQALATIYADTENWLNEHFARLTPQDVALLQQALPLLRQAFDSSP